MTTKNQFTAVYKKTKDWVVAWVEEIPGVNTQGKTMKEARENLGEALLLILEANRDSSRLDTI
jgi:predicted RNase H-like HicB family nuclease